MKLWAAPFDKCMCEVDVIWFTVAEQPRERGIAIMATCNAAALNTDAADTATKGPHIDAKRITLHGRVYKFPINLRRSLC